MKKEYKTSYRVYSAWNYENEIEDLNKASEQGWQLVKGGCFHSRFVKNPDIVYRYQLDYGKIEDMGRYIETFREQGWEYINSTFNNWHYFRKIYDPSLAEEEYEIFTDRESLYEMNNRWATIALIISVFTGIFCIISIVRMIRQPELPRLVHIILFGVESLILLRGTLIMRNTESSRNRKEDNILLTAFFLVIFFGCILNIVLSDKRPYMTTEQHSAGIDQPIVDSRWNEFKVSYPDNYYVDLEMKSDKPMTFQILSENGEPVYEVTDKEFKEENIRLKLKTGTYILSMSADSGFDIKISID